MFKILDITPMIIRFGVLHPQHAVFLGRQCGHPAY